MDTKLLKQKILDLAIRGKLVPQNPADEPASVLLERIKAEKAQLIKEGKIRKEKTLPPIEEVPFEIPESWEWTTIGDFTGDLKYGTAEKSLPEGKVAVLRMGNITRDGSIDYSDLVYTNNESDIEKYILKEGDILFNRTNSSEWVGKCAIYHDGIPAIYAGYIIRFTPIGLNSEYINYVMISNYERDYCAKVKTDGINQSNINSVKLAKLQIPIPPLEEQKRIVAEIDRWFKCIDELEKNQQDLHTAIQQAKSKILDLAIHGKLVPQDANDEPAAVLLERIKAEKAQLIKEGKIKKEKPMESIEDFPFIIPRNWMWTYINTLAIEMADGPFGSNLKAEHYTDKKEVRIIQLSNIGEEGWKETNTKYTTFDHLNTIKRSEVYPGNLVIAKMMPAGRAIICPDHEKGYVLSSDAVKLSPSNCIYNRWLLYTINSPEFKKQVYENVQGVTRVRTSIVKLKQFIVPLPPETEQKRIVTKIEELFAQLDKIEESLN